MKIKTLIVAAIACVALVCTGCSKEETKIVVEVEYEIHFLGADNPDGTAQQFIGECQAACAPISNIDDTKAIRAINPVVERYNHCNKMEGTATLYKSIDKSSRTVVYTWQLEFE